MIYLVIAVKIIIALSVLNVWLFRGSRSTQWRGGDAANIAAEFKAYGLSSKIMYVVGFCKVVLSLLLLVSLAIESLTIYAALGMAVFMIGAILMHLKIADPFKKSVPALIFLFLSLFLVAAEFFNLV